jgi:3-hydroxybutyrate dehydrogenase
MNIAMTERKPAAARSLKDKVSVITGSTSGIGLGIARALAGAGTAIVLNGFGKPEEIEAVRDGVARDFGVHVAYSGADMSNPASIAEMIEMTLDEFGGSTSWSTMPAFNTWRPCRSFRLRSGTRSSPSI